MTCTMDRAEIEYSRAQVTGIIGEWAAEGREPSEINNGSCFEFADDTASRNPGRFMSVGIGDFMLYRGKWADEEYGFDEALLFHQWPTYQPLHGFTWEQMFSWGVFDWPGIHAWVHCRITGLCFDAETPEGVGNPFELNYFAARWKLMQEISEQGADISKGEKKTRILPSRTEEMLADGWKLD